MTGLLERMTSPTRPAALLQAVHPDLGVGLAGSRPSARVLATRRTDGGLLLELAVPGAWARRFSGAGTPSGGHVVVAVDIDGVLHRLALAVAGEGLFRAGALGWRLGVLVPDEDTGAPAVHLRVAVEPGDRVVLDAGPDGAAAVDPTGGPVAAPGSAAAAAPGSAVAAPGSAIAAPGSATGTSHRSVVFASSGVVVDAREGQTLLAAAEEAGLSPSTGCRRGVCHRCSSVLLSGTALNSRDGTVGRAGDSIRICVTNPTSDVEVDL